MMKKLFVFTVLFLFLLGCASQNSNHSTSQASQASSNSSDKPTPIKESFVDELTTQYLTEDDSAKLYLKWRVAHLRLQQDVENLSPAVRNHKKAKYFLTLWTPGLLGSKSVTAFSNRYDELLAIYQQRGSVRYLSRAYEKLFRQIDKLHQQAVYQQSNSTVEKAHQ